MGYHWWSLMSIFQFCSFLFGVVSDPAGGSSLGDLRDSLSSVAVWWLPGHGLVNSLHVYGRFDPCHLTPGLSREGHKRSGGFRRYCLLVKEESNGKDLAQSFVHQNLTLGVWLLGLKWGVCFDRSVLNFILFVKDLSFGEGLIMEKPWICFVVLTFADGHAFLKDKLLSYFRWSAG